MKKFLLIMFLIPVVSAGQCFSVNWENVLPGTVISFAFLGQTVEIELGIRREPGLTYKRYDISSVGARNYHPAAEKFDNVYWIDNDTLHFFVHESVSDGRSKSQYRIASDHVKVYLLDGLTWASSKRIFYNSSGVAKSTFYEKKTEVSILTKPNVTVSYSLSTCVRKIVENKIIDWQQKGEFEKTFDYHNRVNEQSRLVKIQQFEKEAIDTLKHEYFSTYWSQSKSELSTYDADNETFLVSDIYGDFILPVPISKAAQFKTQFTDYIYGEHKFGIIDDKFVLSHLVVLHRKFEEIWLNELRLSDFDTLVKGRDYFVYNYGNTQDYVLTNIDYAFPEIEIDDINTSDQLIKGSMSTNNIKVGTSSVNMNIPNNEKVDNRYAIVIGNEDYSSFQRSLNSEQNVEYAINDASIFKEYCLKTLGVKEENMNFLTNATGGVMNQKINKVLKLMERLGPDAELIFYYAGHGFPDEFKKDPYLIPVDVSGTDLSYAIKLEDLYRNLGNTGARATIFLDACFTGGGRNSGLIAARGVKIKPLEETLNGDVVVFSASSGDQSALPYHKEGHGMFTYFLLKKLQESKGNTSLGDLIDYISSEVSIKSLNINEKEQDPVVNTSEKVSNSWRNWTF